MIWDLHIHTPRCTKISGENKGLATADYVKKLKEMLKTYDVGLISFTDHNNISLEVYDEYISSEYIPFIVGVEIDTKIDGINKFIHLIVYFDIDTVEKYNSNRHIIENFNEFLDAEIRANGEIEIHKLLGKLLSYNINFALSPHAFKQDDRAITYTMTTEDETRDKIKKHIDPFFTFWETASYKETERAIHFLCEFINEEIKIKNGELDMKDATIQLISFSDSNNFEKLKIYLESPHQMFRALPSFRGLQMISSESTRIIRPVNGKIEPDIIAHGNTIGKIEISGQSIYLSNRLNTIIGGRGAGKSILLDSIALSLGKDIQDKERKKFLEKFNPRIFNFNEELIDATSFKCSYFSQSHVAKLFNSVDYSQALQDFFSDEFNDLDIDDATKTLYEIKQYFKDQYNEKVEAIRETEGNISGLVDNYINLNDTDLKLNGLYKKDLSKTDVSEYIIKSKLITAVDKVLPKPLKNNENIQKAIVQLLNTINNEIHSSNKEFIDSSILKDIFINNLCEYKNRLSKEAKAKETTIDLFINEFKYKSDEYVKRVAFINTLIEIDKHFTWRRSVERFFVNSKFKARKVLTIEEPFSFFKRTLEEYLYKTEINDMSLKDLINNYCFNTFKSFKEGKNINSLDLALKEFQLKFTEESIVYYMEGSEYENIKDLSPGTQTNILMEYLVNSDTSVPLLIDQPEDNVDNFTIFDTLRKWFMEFKLRRQVIVVTHDANIVINSDSENIIIAKKETVDKFSYSYGALEYENNLENAAIILDGGKEAIKRRMTKYGE